MDDDYTDEWRDILGHVFDRLRDTYDPDHHKNLKIFYFDSDGSPGGLVLATWGALVPQFLTIFLNDARDKLLDQLRHYSPQDVTVTAEWTG